MSYQEIFQGGKIAPQFIPDAALNSVENPLEATLQAYNPVQLVKHSITGANIVEASVIQTENLALVPGSLQTAIRSDESIELATAKRLVYQDAGEIAVGAGQSMTIAGTLVAPDVAAASPAWANVLGYDPITGAIEYQAAGGGGGGVTNPLSADLGCANFNLNNVGQLNFQGAGQVNAAAANDMNVSCGAGASVVLDAGSVGSLTLNSAGPTVSLKPDTGFCELTMGANAAELVSGDKNCKLVVNGTGGAVSASLKSSAGKGFSTDEASGVVNMQANFGVTAVSLNGGLGGSAAIAGNGNASIVLDSTGGGMCSITAADSFRLTGGNLQSATSSGASGVFLRIQLNGNYYKVALDLD